MKIHKTKSVERKGLILKPLKLEKRTRGNHCVTVFVSRELKSRLQLLAEKYDRTTADIVRAVIRIGIPMMEGLSQAEEIMVNEYISLFRKLRKVRSLKEI